MRKEVIISPSRPDDRLLQHALSLGLRSLYTDPGKIPKKLRKHFKVYHEGGDADVRVATKLEDLSKGGIIKVRVKTAEDVDKVLAAARSGAGAVIVETGDWKIIPLENLVADLRPLGTRLLAWASDVGEVETLLGVLELGVDGVIVGVSEQGELDSLVSVLGAPLSLELREAEVLEVRDVGLGERVCVDTVAMLGEGEGMLVGNTAQMFALIHNESVGSAFTSPRPFRVNAGALHCYTLMPDGSTRYLSELSSGDRVLIAGRSGATRVVAVGRVKIERRPLRLVKLKAGDVEGSITAQNAETIRFISPDGSLKPITEVKPGDRILVHLAEAKARHFGRAVDEFIIER